MHYTAIGPFDITLNPEPLSSVAEQPGLRRLALDKQFQGDLEATSQVEMLSFRSSVQNSAGYVAMEVVHGTLHGRSGSFVLQHSSSMNRGTPFQSITVVPDSGTDALSGLTGSMVITITDGQHSYKFEYALPDQS
ncbi:MAG: DUF3224 domain-containing protein [Candidatus Pseudomonas phytovorans]|uniref:DUF3224 domain-containing protein n=1 Tax=Candidatus Pseudomonas phytovorans TaxID=3121377 RepID=A0AAJ5WNP0_9PSED|nr:DUF3224 domain-containing protein [Pseudomonas sp.]WEK32923.1 MAG: DUF3224 domain-containing protein [Pseudomonas sp.]